MPARSAKQYRFMRAVKSGSAIGPSKEVVEEFIQNTPKKKKQLFMKKGKK